jgi:heme-degrading monooxygenase HmoA
MSVVITVQIPVKASALEGVTAEQAELMRTIAADGKSKGAKHHMFVGDAEGNAVVVDEWESEDAFHAFFDSQPDVPKLMADLGAAGPPVVTAYRILDTPDRF